jgi:hypothetical protein
MRGQKPGRTDEKSHKVKMPVSGSEAIDVKWMARMKDRDSQYYVANHNETLDDRSIY